MNTLPVISVIFGIVLILGRAPLLFRPVAMQGFIRGIIGNATKLRLMGTIVLLAGVCMIIVALTIEKSYPEIVLALGCLFTLVAAVFLLTTAATRKLAVRIWSMSPGQARLLGLISVLFGAYLIYLGLEEIL